MRATLTPKQQCFVDEFLVDLNATQAAIRAGYSPKTARAMGAENLTKPDIAAALAAAQAARATRTHVTQDGILCELALIAHSDLSNYTTDARGQVTARAGTNPNVMHAVASLKTKVTHHGDGVTFETTIRLWDKTAALRMEGQHLGLFVPVEAAAELGFGLAVLLAGKDAARARLAARVEQLARREAEGAPDGTA